MILEDKEFCQRPVIQLFAVQFESEQNWHCSPWANSCIDVSFCVMTNLLLTLCVAYKCVTVLEV